MTSWHSYPSIYNMGHRAVTSLLTGPVNVEEKIDGSQFSFGLFLTGYCDKCGIAPEKHVGSAFSDHEYLNMETHLKVRSKGAVMEPDAPEKMFSKGVEAVKERLHLLKVGWTYRGEYLQKPKHNALAYNRIPHGHVIIFDINTAEETYLSYDEKVREAAQLGFEVVPLIYTGVIRGIDEFRGFLSKESVLGGQKIEGVVVKPRNYDLYSLDKKVLMGKYVSEAFKEVHGRAWKGANPKGGDILVTLGDKFCHPGRWAKAVMHLREQGLITDSPKDIPKIMIEVQKDLGKEEEEEIKRLLWKWAWPAISRAAIRGLPEWYKERLLAQAFEQANENQPSEQGASNPEAKDDTSHPDDNVRNSNSDSNEAE